MGNVSEAVRRFYANLPTPEEEEEMLDELLESGEEAQTFAEKVKKRVSGEE